MCISRGWSRGYGWYAGAGCQGFDWRANGWGRCSFLDDLKLLFESREARPNTDHHCYDVSWSVPLVYLFRELNLQFLTVFLSSASIPLMGDSSSLFDFASFSLQVPATFTSPKSSSFSRIASSIRIAVT